MIPACVVLLAFDTPLFGFLPIEQIEGKAAQGGQVFGCISGTGTALIFVERNVHHPMHFVFHAQVVPHGAGNELHVQRQTREIVATFDRLLAADFPDEFHEALRL